MLVTTSGVAVLSVVLAAWELWFMAVDKPVHIRQLVFAVLIEIAILVQAISAAIGMVAGHDPREGFMFWGYLVVSLLVLPVAAAWSFAERTRWSSLTMAIAALALLALQARVWQLWSA